MSTDIRLIAQAYLDHGWHVVPLVKGEKRASSSWQKKTYAADAFGPTDGLALKRGLPSAWRVDVDCDAPESLLCAQELLPQTGLVHGRPGKPGSHYWYVSEGAKSASFTDVKNDTHDKPSMLVELRSTGGYTVAPPSLWTDKHDPAHTEQVAWEIERDPMILAPEDLSVAVRDLALATLLARHWPTSGSRHAMVGPLAGFLCQANVPDIKVIATIRAAARAANDTDLEDRLHYAHATVAKFRRGERVTGGPSLADCLGPNVVAKMRSWLKVADLDAIEDMNTRHFVVRLGKDTVIGREDTGDGVPRFQRAEALHVEYANRQVVGTGPKGEPRTQKLFPAWLESPARRDYREVVFNPPPHVTFPGDATRPGDYNLWRGFAIAPVAGDCPLLLAHLRDVICHGDDAHAKYLCKLLAFTVQYPGLPSGVAVVLRGERGAGKGILIRALMSLFGPHAVHLDKTKHLVGGFNASISAKVVVFADEAIWGGDQHTVGALNRIITEPTVHIERKGIDAVDERNCIHLFVATNQELSVPAAFKERRYFALKVSDARIGDFAYFAALHAEMYERGGLAGFLDLLLTLPVTMEEVLDVPKTPELRNQQDESMSSELAWLMDVLDTGEGWPKDDADRWLEGTALYTAFKLAYPRESLNAMKFGKRLGDIISAENARTHRFSGKAATRGWNTRTLFHARQAFDKKRGSPTEWLPLPDGCFDPREPRQARLVTR